MTPFKMLPAFLLATLPAVAHAELTLLSPTFDHTFGVPAEYSEVAVTGAGTSGGSLFAGTIHVTSNELGDIEAYCIEIPQALALPALYKRVQNPFSDVTSDRLSRLFTGYYDRVDGDVERAAFQVAVWELTVDGTPDLDSGDFADFRNPAVVRTARGFLASLDQFEPEYEMIFLQSNMSQDVVAGLPRSNAFQGF